MSRQWIWIAPELGSCNRTMQRATVDLPQPDSPTMPKISPPPPPQKIYLPPPTPPPLAVGLAQARGLQDDRALTRRPRFGHEAGHRRHQRSRVGRRGAHQDVV